MLFFHKKRYAATLQRSFHAVSNHALQVIASNASLRSTVQSLVRGFGVSETASQDISNSTDVSSTLISKIFLFCLNVHSAIRGVVRKVTVSQAYFALHKTLHKVQHFREKIFWY